VTENGLRNTYQTKNHSSVDGANRKVMSIRSARRNNERVLMPISQDGSNYEKPEDIPENIFLFWPNIIGKLELSNQKFACINIL